MSISLWQQDVPGDFQPFMDYFPCSADNAPAIVIFPGGAYTHRAGDYEGADLAKLFNKIGVHGFVVQYRVFPNQHPSPIQDAARALRLIRHNASKWKINPNKITVVGFSAGGHLAASLSVHFDKNFTADSGMTESCQPNGCILSYPVISTGKVAHKGSFKSLFGENVSEEKLKLMSLEKQIHPKTPPTFIWHTIEDKGVPFQNSILYAEALAKKNIPVEMHLFNEGKHGLGLAESLNAGQWVELALKWHQDIFK